MLTASPPAPRGIVRRARGFVGKIDRAVFRLPGSSLTAALQEALAPGLDRVLDVGCGDQGSLVKRAPGLAFTVGVDAVLPEADAGAPRHSEYRQLDIRSLGEHFGDGEFNCVVALDVIEHLTRTEGAELLRAMERIASERVIVFTPNGFLPQAATPGNPHQEHVSGWTATDFSGRGYRVMGINGWRPLRGMYAEIRWLPRTFWQRVSALTEPATRRLPRFAFQLLCVKDVGDR